MSSAVCGYGICVSDEIKNYSFDSVKALIAMSEKLQQELKDCIDDCEQESNGDVEEFCDLLSSETEEEAGLATLLSEVIHDCEGINLLGTTDSWCNSFLILEKKNPWNYTENERHLSSEDIDEVIRQYVSVLTDEDVLIDEQTVIND